jgi:hypothetical protein
MGNSISASCESISDCSIQSCVQSRNYIADNTTGRFAFVPPAPSRIKKPHTLVESVNGVKIPIVMFSPNRNVSLNKSKYKQLFKDYCLIYSHGNACDLGQSCDLLEDICEHVGLVTCGYDYQGYGQSEPKLNPSFRATKENLLTTIKYVNSLGFTNDKIILYGQSIGSGPSTYGAGQVSIGGLILHSPFKSLVKTQVDQSCMNLVTPLVDGFSNDKNIKMVKCPVFIIHGDKDHIVPHSHGQTLSTLAPNLYKLHTVKHAGHNDVIEVMGEDNYFQEIISYINFLIIN